jgi:hypothetical protein
MSSSSRSLFAKRNPPNPLLEVMRRLQLTLTMLVLFGVPHLIGCVRGMVTKVYALAGRRH